MTRETTVVVNRVQATTSFPLLGRPFTLGVPGENKVERSEKEKGVFPKDRDPGTQDDGHWGDGVETDRSEEEVPR